MSHVSHSNGSCHSYAHVMPHIRMVHTTRARMYVRVYVCVCAVCVRVCVLSVWMSACVCVIRVDVCVRCVCVHVCVASTKKSTEKMSATDSSNPSESRPLYSETLKTYFPGVSRPNVMVSGLPPLLSCEVASRSRFTSVTLFVLHFCCSVLRCVAMCCRLQVVVCHSVLYDMRCSLLQLVAVCCSVLQCVSQCAIRYVLRRNPHVPL